MYRTRKKIALIGINILSIIIVILVTLFLLPARKNSDASIYTFVVTSVIMLAVLFWGNRIKNFFLNKIRKDTLESGETVIINQFIIKR